MSLLQKLKREDFYSIKAAKILNEINAILTDINRSIYV